MAGMAGAVIAFHPRTAKAYFPHGVGVNPPTTFDIVQPPISWNGIQGSGGAIPTASLVPYGSGFDGHQVTGAFTGQRYLEVVSDNTHQVIAHGGNGADLNNKLDHVEIVIEGSTPVIISGMQWMATRGFGYPFSFRHNGQCGVAQGYIRFIPVNGLERIVDFTVWFNVSGVTGFKARPGVYVDAIHGNDSTGNGTSGNPYQTLPHVTGLMTGANDGQPVYCQPGFYAMDVDPAVNLTTTYPTEIWPAPGATQSQVVIGASTRANGSVALRGQYVVFRGVTVDMTTIWEITPKNANSFAMVGFRNSDISDPSPNLNGPQDTWGGTTWDTLYDNATTSQTFIRSDLQQMWTFMIDCTLSTQVVATFKHIVNVSAPGGGPARFCWDFGYLSVASVNDINSFWTFNYRGVQVGRQKGRLHSSVTQVAASTVAYDGTNTTISFSGTPLNATNADVGFMVLTGALAGHEIYFEGAVGSCTSSAVVMPGNTVQDVNGVNVTMANIASGDLIRVYHVAHADALQSSWTTTLSSRQYGFDNVYFQGYQVTGPYVQALFIQNNTNTTLSGTFTSSGTTLSCSTSQTFFAGDCIHRGTGGPNTGTQTGDWAFIAVGGAGTTFTLEAAFQSGDITTPTACGLGKPMRSFYMVNCFIDKLLDGPEQAQIQAPVYSFGHLCCTILTRTSAVPASSGGYTIRPRQPGFGMKGWAAKASIFEQLGVDFTSPSSSLPTTFMIADHNQFMSNASVPVGSSSDSTVGALTFTGLAPIGGTTAVCDAATVAAAPFGIDGSRRRIGDPVGAWPRAA